MTQQRPQQQAQPRPVAPVTQQHNSSVQNQSPYKPSTQAPSNSYANQQTVYQNPAFQSWEDDDWNAPTSYSQPIQQQTIPQPIQQQPNIPMEPEKKQAFAPVQNSEPVQPHKPPIQNFQNQQKGKNDWNNRGRTTEPLPS